MEAGRPLRLTEKRRGDAEPAPDQLELARRLWLDFDGGGYTVTDEIQGVVRRSARLEMGAAAELGRVAIDGRDQVITRVEGSTQSGVEVPRGALQLRADSRLPGGRSLPAVGWDHDFQSLRAVLHLPPGWRIVHALGVDASPDTWLARWTLLDLFAVLILAAAFFRLWGSRWGALALVGLALTWTEPRAPHWAWAAVLAGEALLRALPRAPLPPVRASRAAGPRRRAGAARPRVDSFRRSTGPGGALPESRARRRSLRSLRARPAARIANTSSRLCGQGGAGHARDGSGIQGGVHRRGAARAGRGPLFAAELRARSDGASHHGPRAPGLGVARRIAPVERSGRSRTAPRPPPDSPARESHSRLRARRTDRGPARLRTAGRRGQRLDRGRSGRSRDGPGRARARDSRRRPRRHPPLGAPGRAAQAPARSPGVLAALRHRGTPRPRRLAGHAARAPRGRRRGGDRDSAARGRAELDPGAGRRRRPAGRRSKAQPRRSPVGVSRARSPPDPRRRRAPRSRFDRLPAAAPAAFRRGAGVRLDRPRRARGRHRGAEPAARAHPRAGRDARAHPRAGRAARLRASRALPRPGSRVARRDGGGACLPRRHGTRARGAAARGRVGHHAGHPHRAGPGAAQHGAGCLARRLELDPHARAEPHPARAGGRSVRGSVAPRRASGLARRSRRLPARPPAFARGRAHSRVAAVARRSPRAAHRPPAGCRGRYRDHRRDPAVSDAGAARHRGGAPNPPAQQPRRSARRSPAGRRGAPARRDRWRRNARSARKGARSA